MAFLKLNSFLSNFQFVSNSHFQCVVFPLMAYRKFKTNRVVVLFDDISNNFIQRFSKRSFGVPDFGKAADYQARQIFEFPTSFELVEQAVDTVQLFANIFEEKYFATGVKI